MKNQVSSSLTRLIKWLALQVIGPRCIQGRGSGHSPIAEGSTVITKVGPVRTDHMLFIAQGPSMFPSPATSSQNCRAVPHSSQPESLRPSDFARILTEPQNSLTKQYTALLATENIQLQFTEDGISAIAQWAAEVNSRTENIGARRLHTIMENPEDVSFTADGNPRQVVIDEPVRSKLQPIAEDDDLAVHPLAQSRETNGRKVAGSIDQVRRLNRMVSGLASFQPDFTGIMLTSLRNGRGPCGCPHQGRRTVGRCSSTGEGYIDDLPQIVREQISDVEGPLAREAGENLDLPREHAVLCPIVAGDDRLGTLIINHHRELSEVEEFMAEYAAALLGMLMGRWKENELQAMFRQRTACQVAVGSMSFSEQQAARHIINQLDGLDGMIIISKTAEEVGITRSVVISGLRKLESAGLIETHSLGMKGTYVRLLNELLPKELEEALGIK